MKTKSDNSSKVELRLPTEEENNQKRSVSMFLKSSDFDHLDSENRFVRMGSNPCDGHSTDERGS